MHVNQGDQIADHHRGWGRVCTGSRSVGGASCTLAITLLDGCLGSLCDVFYFLLDDTLAITASPVPND